MSPTSPRPRLREAREAAGLTQQELADEVGAGRTTIIRAEQGSQAPSLELANRLAEALDTTIDELFGDPERETPERAYWRGHREGREEQERADRANAGPQPGQSGDGDRPGVAPDTPDPYGVAAFVSEALQTPPSAPDSAHIWLLPNPRGTTRKLDAVVTVVVRRRPPREARRLFRAEVAEPPEDGGPE